MVSLEHVICCTEICIQVLYHLHHKLSPESIILNHHTCTFNLPHFKYQNHKYFSCLYHCKYSPKSTIQLLLDLLAQKCAFVKVTPKQSDLFIFYR